LKFAPALFPWLTIALKRAMSSTANTPEEHERQQEYLRDFLTLFQNATKEARYGVVLQDMRVVVDVLNRLDSLLQQVEIRFGLDQQPISSPLATAEGAGALRVQLRLEPTEPGLPEIPKTPRPGQPMPPPPPSFAFGPGQIWQRPDGRAEFRVFAANEDLVEIQWFLQGRFKNQNCFPTRDLLLYVTENKMQPVLEPLPTP
jgi:hypothetical protein